jgi:hypothetical protein
MGPAGVKIFGVWQSLQPPAMTRYFPRSTSVGAVLFDVHAGIIRPTVMNRNKEKAIEPFCGCMTTPF